MSNSLESTLCHITHFEMNKQLWTEIEIRYFCCSFWIGRWLWRFGLHAKSNFVEIPHSLISPAKINWPISAIVKCNYGFVYACLFTWEIWKVFCLQNQKPRERTHGHNRGLRFMYTNIINIKFASLMWPSKRNKIII